MITEKLDAFLQARTHLFAALDLPPGDVEDLRERRWSGDHGAVWWEDAEGRRRDASITNQWVNSDGLFVCRDRQRHVWLVFTQDREDASFEF